MKLDKLKDSEKYVVFVGLTPKLNYGIVYSGKFLSVQDDNFKIAHEPIEYEVKDYVILTAAQVKAGFDYLQKKYATDDEGIIDSRAWDATKKMLEHNTYTLDKFTSKFVTQ